MNQSPIPVVPVGAVACATMLWRERGLLRVTVIVKATYAFVHDGVMHLVDPLPIHEAEVHYQNNPMFSVMATSDLVPYRPFTDVILQGHAYAPHHQPATSVALRLRIVRGQVLLDKLLLAVGDQSPGGIVPFQRIPIVYEKAYGGIGSQDNPLGVGVGSDARTPNIVDPQNPQSVAGFGPISATWPVRKFMLTDDQRKALAQPPIELHDKLEWSYFQAAPLDQRTGYLHGDETLILEGMHPVLHSVTTRLPGAHAMARIHCGDDDGYPLQLHADTLVIDADAERCSVTWRGNIAVGPEGALDQIWIAAAVDHPGAESIKWPAEPQRHLESFTHLANQDVNEHAGSHVVTTDPERTLVLPHAIHSPQAEVMAPGLQGEPLVINARSPLDDAVIAVNQNKMTTTLDPRQLQHDALPFLRDASAPGPATGSPTSAPLPGAPWNPKPAPYVPPLTPNLESTLDLATALQYESTTRAQPSATDHEPEVLPPENMTPRPPEPKERDEPPPPPVITPPAEVAEVARQPSPPPPPPKSPFVPKPAATSFLYKGFAPKTRK